jgi:tripartite-type tricarboxylate transporter receptor subunit TctC
LRQVGERDDVKKILTDLKARPVLDTPAEFATLLKDERALWDRVIKKAQITLE